MNHLVTTATPARRDLVFRDFCIYKALVLVLLLAASNALCDVIYEQLDLESSSRSDPRRLAMIVGRYARQLWESRAGGCRP